MQTGYPGTRLQTKPGIRPGMKIWLINPTVDYDSLIETNSAKFLCNKNETPDFVHLFVKTVNEFETKMKKIKTAYKKNTSFIIWASWHKENAKIPTDVTEDVIRNHALKNDLADVKVCSVSEVRSGLKLVVPLKKRW